MAEVSRNPPYATFYRFVKRHGPFEVMRSAARVHSHIRACILRASDRRAENCSVTATKYACVVQSVFSEKFDARSPSVTATNAHPAQLVAQCVLWNGIASLGIGEGMFWFAPELVRFYWDAVGAKVCTC